jgi:Zn-dependent M28 family amino/carboxypeptidase
MLPGMSWIKLSGDAADYHPELLGAATLNVAAAVRLFDGAPLSFNDALDAADAGEPRSAPLGIELTLRRKTGHQDTSSANLIGLVPGNDPALRDEFVVFSAHLDHIGVGTPVNGDDIYNGAYDNAMGVSHLIEAAHAFSAMPEGPRRSILFIALTGEERGLLGSDYFAHHPTVPSDSMVADINLDMPLLLYPIADIIAFGAEHSTLNGIIATAIAGEGFTLAPDPLPEEVLFIRSDQYSFVRQGIPSVFLVPGFTSSDAEIDGRKLFMSHLRSHNHRPSDDLSRPVHWPSALRFARANVRISHANAENSERPARKPGDFFGEKFGRPAAARPSD